VYFHIARIKPTCKANDTTSKNANEKGTPKLDKIRMIDTTPNVDDRYILDNNTILRVKYRWKIIPPHKNKYALVKPCLIEIIMPPILHHTTKDHNLKSRRFIWLIELNAI
jgi:hypothetical protein